MKSKKKNISMFWMLVFQYTCFAAIVLVALGGIGKFMNQLITNSYSNPAFVHGEEIAQYAADGKESSIPKNWLNGNGWYLLIGEDGTPISGSSGSPENLLLNAEDVSILSIGDGYIGYTEYQEEDGAKTGEYIAYSPESTAEGSAFSIEGMFLVDVSTGTVTYSTLDKIPVGDHISETLRMVLIGESSGSTISVYSETMQDGSPCVVLVGVPKVSTVRENSKIDLVIQMYDVILIAAFVIILLVFVLWLSRWFRKPITMLSKAMTEVAEGNVGEQIAYRGPAEFTEMCDSFNTMSARLEKTEQERRQAEQEKQQMLADISHDLKTPITVIEGYARAIRDGVIPESQEKQYLSLIEEKSEQLTGLINEFHTFSKMDHPAYHLVLQKTDLTETVRQYLAGKYPECELSGDTLEADLPETEIPCMLDTALFHRALDNIVNNSIRHNAAGIVIHASLQKEEKTAVLILEDSGSGLSDYAREHIFEPFVTGNDARNSKGSGLGMAITKKIIEAEGGTIELLPETETWKTRFAIHLRTL
ncbi:HAMP domain-containing sensor histidine kinase [Stecheria intestinalis]|uniref:HAMP domain-containing sensor histidine kinase n=1 Tax=Stecheria intestinalis TaxID=2606630 RepID=UPI0023F4287F|nr:HAMP domain-containing sensor histidine kinase [Stecheria intestinalis]MDD5881620.1 HAMP domain-containing sensor histidine kinase [Stecheria intestinalis]